MKLIDEGKALEAKEVDERALGVLHEDRLKILKTLGEPHYAAEISKILRMHSQTVYYHLRILAKEKLIELKSFEEKHGGVAKKYVATTEALVLPISEKWRPFAEGKRKTPAYLNGFVKDGFLDAKLVVGSPEPHGKHRARGSEFTAIELAAFLAQYASFEYPLYYLDTKASAIKNENLFLVGGPKVNTLTAEVNSSLPIRFTPSFEVHSTLTGKKYGEDVGILETVESPFAESKKVFIVAGSSHNTTRVAVLALIKNKTWHKQDSLAHVVQGFDDDGDGIVDAVEVLE
ncbi:S-layer protein [Candidatus Micrarchaeota archaeon]|nr:S-layer protein [Candidatus Micrarchaeota archaeon]